MIGKLEMLIALAKEQHFGRAATTLGITQPTLSSGIRQLEDTLGVKLVQRGSRFGGLTPEGQRALQWARQIVGDTRKLRDEMRATRRGLSGHLRLAVIPTALPSAARLASGFSDAHPNVSFTILSRSSAEILDMLENLDIDVGISYLDNEELGRVSTKPLYTEHFTLVCRPEHPLAAREALDWSDLGDLKLCLLSPDMQNRRIINRNFARAGVDPKALIESNSTVVLVSTVRQGDWVTVLPEEIAEFLCQGKGLRVIPVGKGETEHAIGLIAPHQEPYTPVLQALLREAQGLVARS